MIILTRAFICLIALGACVAAAAAQQMSYAGPSGWSHQSPQSDASRSVEQWKLATEIVTFSHDSTANYTDQVATIKKNLAEMGAKPTLDKDLTCRGRQSHVFEFAFGPEGSKKVMNRLLVPDGTPTGITTITYTRSADNPYDDDVKKSIDAFCKAG